MWRSQLILLVSVWCFNGCLSASRAVPNYCTDISPNCYTERHRCTNASTPQYAANCPKTCNSPRCYSKDSDIYRPLGDDALGRGKGAVAMQDAFADERPRPEWAKCSSNLDADMTFNASAFIAHVTDFSLRLYRTLIGKPNENLLVSPISVLTTLEMLYEGSDGNTTRELADVVFARLPREVVKRGYFSIFRRFFRNSFDITNDMTRFAANFIFAKSNLKFNPRYRDDALNCFGANVVLNNRLSTEGAETANRMIEQMTHGYLKNLLTSELVSNQVVLMLISVLYFKANWQYPFTNGETLMHKFVTPERSALTEMMVMDATLPFYENKEGGYKILGLPYENGEQTMYLFIDTKNQGLAHQQSLLTPTFLNEFSLKLVNQPVNVIMPKFNLTTKRNLRHQLEKMGVRDVFATPNLSNMIVDNYFQGFNLSVSDIMHTVTLEVNENGTVAAAASAAAISFTSYRPTFHANKPFVFLIRDHPTNTILFMGHFSNPWQPARN